MPFTSLVFHVKERDERTEYSNKATKPMDDSVMTTDIFGLVPEFAISQQKVSNGFEVSTWIEVVWPSFSKIMTNMATWVKESFVDPTTAALLRVCATMDICYSLWLHSYWLFTSKEISKILR